MLRDIFYQKNYAKYLKTFESVHKIIYDSLIYLLDKRQIYTKYIIEQYKPFPTSVGEECCRGLTVIIIVFILSEKLFVGLIF